MSEDQGAATAVETAEETTTEEQKLFTYTYTSQRPESDPLWREPFEVRAPNLEAANLLAISEHDFDPRKEMTSPDMEEGCPEIVAFQARRAELEEQDRLARKPQVDALREQLAAQAIDPSLIPSDEVLDGLIKSASRILAASPEFAADLNGAAQGLGVGAERYAGPGLPGSTFPGPNPFERFMLGEDRPPSLTGQSPFAGLAAAATPKPSPTQSRIELFREVVCGGAAWLGERLKLLPRDAQAGFQSNPTPLYTLGQEAAALSALAGLGGWSELAAPPVAVDPYAPTETQDENF